MGRKDPSRHAYRKPRPCGLTVHPALGCSLGCVYCYVPETGIRGVRVSELSGEELVREIRANPYFVEGRMGTFLAIGSVCEPLHPMVFEKTVEFIEALKALGNPIQVATKWRALEDPSPLREVNVLVSVCTIRHAEALEPGAPPPEERMELIKQLRKAGAYPYLFLRPIIPGVTEAEAAEILRAARDSGALGVVVGSLRVTKRIVERLKRSGVDCTEVLRRAPKLDSRQRYIRELDLKRRIMEEARRAGLTALGQACCASARSYGVPCAGLCWARGRCSSCGNACLSKLPDNVNEALRELGLEGEERDGRILVKGPVSNALVVRLETMARRVVEVVR